MEMPPAAVKRHDEIGIAPSCNSRHPARRVVEPLGGDPEMPGLAALGRGEDHPTAFADRGGAEQILGLANLLVVMAGLDPAISSLSRRSPGQAQE